MTDVRGTAALESFLAGAHIGDGIADLRPDYRALLVAADGLVPAVQNEVGEDGASEALVARAEAVAHELLSDARVEDLPHVDAWREAYRAFGAKPQRTRNSLEALLRRTASGFPRVNPLTDLYNAVSVVHQLPIGGEDLAAYAGAPRLLRATGDEPFDTTADGDPVVEHPDQGEVVWCDDAGVTCRRWNWRQGRRTRLTADTTSALFILDALEPMSDAALAAAGDELVDHLRRRGPDLRIATRVVTAGTTVTTARVPAAP